MPANLQKTTVYLDLGDYERLKRMARRERRSTADLIREAVAVFARRPRGRALPRSLGAGRSGRGDVAERAAENRGGMGSG